MKLILDTHLLLWSAREPGKLSRSAAALLSDPENELIFSTVSVWEAAIKSSLGKKDFQTDPRLLRRRLLDNGYTELPITSNHAVTIDQLPPIHKDLFDRILVAQAIVEGITLLTADSTVAKYPGPIRRV
jgi:PIN domain nuclease of toxin-antitoxin system